LKYYLRKIRRTRWRSWWGTPLQVDSRWCHWNFSL